MDAKEIEYLRENVKYKFIDPWRIDQETLLNTPIVKSKRSGTLKYLRDRCKDRLPSIVQVTTPPPVEVMRRT